MPNENDLSTYHVYTFEPAVLTILVLLAGNGHMQCIILAVLLVAVH